MARTKKLTDAQKAALTRLSEGKADYYDLIKFGANGSTTDRLVKLGLAKELGHKLTGRDWEITDKGRDALASGRITLDL